MRPSTPSTPSAMTILDCLDDSNLLGAAFAHTESWAAWRAFLAACFGLRMTDEQAALYRQHTGRQAAPTSPAREAWLVAGRRGGKSRIAALVAVYLACFRDYRAVLAPGERGTLPVIAADRQAIVASVLRTSVQQHRDPLVLLVALQRSPRPIVADLRLPGPAPPT